MNEADHNHNTPRCAVLLAAGADLLPLVSA